MKIFCCSMRVSSRGHSTAFCHLISFIAGGQQVSFCSQMNEICDAPLIPIDLDPKSIEFDALRVEGWGPMFQTFGRSVVDGSCGFVDFGTGFHLWSASSSN
jgi:hypothetical protein